MKIKSLIVVTLLLSGLLVGIIPEGVSAFSKEVSDFDRIWYDENTGFNKNGIGILVLAVGYTNLTFRNIDHCSIQFTKNPLYFSIEFTDELEIIRDPEGNIIYQEPEDGYVFLRKSFVDNYLPQDIKRLASKNINYKTIEYQGILWYRIYVPDFNHKYEWKKYIEPDLNEKWYTWGSDESILFSERAMYIELTEEDTGHLLFDFSHPTDNSGQTVAISKSYFLSKGITKPYFEWGKVNPWKPIGYTENETHYFIEPEHFSWIGIHEATSGTVNGSIVDNADINYPYPFVHDIVNDEGDGSSDTERVLVGTQSGVLSSSIEFHPTVNASIDVIKVNTGSYVGTPYALDVNIYMDNSTVDTDWTDGTLVKTDWTPTWTTGYQTITLDTSYNITASTTYEIGFVSQTEYGVTNYINLQTDTSPSSDYYYWGRPGLTRSYTDYGDIICYTNQTNFTATRTATASSEVNNLSFTPSDFFNGTMMLRVPVSTSVSAIVDVTNNTAVKEATAVNSSDDLVNNTYFFDSTNFFVYIRTTNLTTSSTVNWTINCSYASEFSITIPTFKDVGDDIVLEGVIKDINGVGLNGIMAKTYVYYSNLTVAIGPIEHNCTGGNFHATITTTSLMPGIYAIIVRFTDLTDTTFEVGGYLYLSYPTPTGVYSDALVFFNFYNTNEGLGLPTETLKIYVNDVRQYETTYYAYTGEEINVVVKDYYNLTMYDGNFTITYTYTYLDFGLTFHSYKFCNLNEEFYMISFLKDGGSRWFERGICPYETVEFLLPSGDYSLRIYDADNNTLYSNYSISMVNSKLYVLNGSHLLLVIDGQSVIVGDLLELSGEFEELSENFDYALMPDIEIILFNPPMIYSVFDKEGMAIGGNVYQICPALITIATTRVETTGNWINSTTRIPGNDTVENGTITIITDTLYISGNGSTSYINITYSDNGTLMQNTTYIPSKINLYGQNLTINASGDIHILRETKYNQMKKFYWTYYSDTGKHTAGIDVINPMNIPIYDVYVYVEFSNQSTPDSKTVIMKDVSNAGIILERGKNYDVTGSGIHFYLLSIESDSTRGFIIEYYKQFEDAYNYGEATINIPGYVETVWNGLSFNTFTIGWINDDNTIFRGGLYAKLVFLDEIPTEINKNSIRIWDEDNNRELNDFIAGDNFIRIGAEGLGDIAPGGGRSFSVYFLLATYPGADPTEIHLNTPIWGIVTPFLIIFIIGLIFIGYGVYNYMYKDKKDWWQGIGLGVFIIFIFYILAYMGV